MDVQRGGQGRGLIASASDDGTVRVWSQESKEEIEVVELGYPITAVRPAFFFRRPMLMWSGRTRALYDRMQD